MLYDEIQSTIEPVPSPSSAPAIFVEAPEIEILPAEPTASNEIIQHNPENLPHNDDILQHEPENLMPNNEIILFTNSQQMPAIKFEQDILHDNHESELIAEEVEILQHDPENLSDNQLLQHDPENVSNNEILHEHDASTTIAATNSVQVNEDTTGFLNVQQASCSASTNSFHSYCPIYLLFILKSKSKFIFPPRPMFRWGKWTLNLISK